MTLSFLGGKAAIETVFGEIDMGAEHDIRNAKYRLTDLENDCTAYGFDYAIGLISADIYVNKSIERENAELNRLYTEAKRILIENRAFLDAVANALLEKETIFSSDIQAIKKELKLA